MSTQVDSYPHFIESGIELNSLKIGDCNNIFYGALEEANRKLEKEGIKVFFVEQVPKKPISYLIDHESNILLGIEKDSQSEHIDIIDIKALDGKSIKPLEILS